VHERPKPLRHRQRNLGSDQKDFHQRISTADDAKGLGIVQLSQKIDREAAKFREKISIQFLFFLRVTSLLRCFAVICI
jgi:ribosome-binding protein aMBF1 (putative translation factor)